MIKKIKQLFCSHDYEVVSEKVLPGYIPNEGVLKEAELKCKKCGKRKILRGLSIGRRDNND